MDEFKEHHEFDVGNIPLSQEKVLPSEKLDKGKVESQSVKNKLDELTKEFYLFDLLPFMSVVKLDVDLIYQFAKDFKMDRIKVINIDSPISLYTGVDRPFNLKGIFKEHKQVFRKYMLQTLFIGHSKPRQYWRADYTEATINLQAVVSYPTKVDIWLPSGEKAKLGVSGRPNGTFDFIKLPPEQWIVDAAINYFITMGVKHG